MASLQSATDVFRVATQATLAETHKILVATAKREHARVMADDPRPTGFTRQVDGVLGAPEETVKPNGVIRYHYPRMEQVIRFAMETLIEMSPSKSGAYRNSHTLFVDGHAAPTIAAARPGAEISIGNPLPYSRKIEVGTMKMRVAGTERVYRRAQKAVMARFGNTVNVKFAYRSIVGGTAKRGSRETRAPVLIFVAR